MEAPTKVNGTPAKPLVTNVARQGIGLTSVLSTATQDGPTSTSASPTKEGAPATVAVDLRHSVILDLHRPRMETPS